MQTSLLVNKYVFPQSHQTPHHLMLTRVNQI